MTNLDIIKYLATNNPTRLAKLLDDICDNVYYIGYTDDIDALPHFEKLLSADASQLASYYRDGELEEWSKVINPISTLEVFYGSKSKVIDQAIDEVKLLENVIEPTKHSGIDYVRFRKSVCAYCSDVNCMRSQMEICDCPKFEGYYEVKENK